MTTTQPQIKSEAQLQALLWKIAWNEYPQSRGHIWAIPNGAKRSMYERTLSKATGTLAGVWDLHCYYQGKFYIFELKFGKGKLSTEQQAWREKMLQSGATAYVLKESDVEFWRRIMTGIFGDPA